MMMVVEAAFILPYSFNAYSEALSDENLVRDIPRCSVDGFD